MTNKSYDIHVTSLAEINELLKDAISEIDRVSILELYDYVAEMIDLDKADESDFNRYDQLVSIANDLLYRGEK